MPELIPQSAEAARAHLEAIIERTGDLATSLATLDQLARDSDAKLPADFRHYLQRRSYQKALAFLDGDLDPRH